MVKNLSAQYLKDTEETRALIIILRRATFLSFEIEIQHHQPQLDKADLSFYLVWHIFVGAFCFLSCAHGCQWKAAPRTCSSLTHHF